ncbi:MAG TPA: hypothetical protein VMY99_04725 [Nevskiaceae bacterium]|nr:hypothetical protein [Nevskiaceae bacterium]
MDVLQKLEVTLDEVLHKKAPFQLPENGKKSLAAAFWWIALVIGLLQVWAVFGLWHLGHVANRVVDLANSLSLTYGNGEITGHLGFFYYLSVGVLAFDAALLLLAVSGLKALKKAGWNLLYYSLLLNVAYGVVRLFTDSAVGGGFSSFVGSLLGSVVGAYFLFQVRSYFVGHKSPSSPKPAVSKKA